MSLPPKELPADRLAKSLRRGAEMDDLRRNESAPRTKSPVGFESGFTLLELAIIIFIIALVTTLVMPYLGGIQSAQLQSQARRLAARANYLYNEASAQKVLIRLTFDLNTNTYFATRLDPFAAVPKFVPETGPAGGVVAMPSDIKIRDVWVEGIGTLRRGLISCQFYPGGYADATVIHLADQDGEVFTMGINPFSGHVQIVRGDLKPSATIAMAQ